MRKERRLANLQRLIDTRYAGVIARFAEEVGRQPSYIYRLFTTREEHRRGIADDLADDIEQKLGLPPYWLDRLDDEADAVPQGPPPLPPDAEKFAREWLTLPADARMRLVRALMDEQMVAMQVKPEEVLDYLRRRHK